MHDVLPIGLTRKQLTALVYALRLAAINCHEDNEPEINALLHQIQAFMIAYGMKP